MSEHYPRNTLECTAWCARCQNFTQHRVDNGRQGPCLVTHPETAAAKARREQKARHAQERLENPDLPWEGDR